MIDKTESAQQTSVTESRRITLEAEPASLELDLNQTCVLIVDMQNAFLAEGAYMDLLGFDVKPSRTTFEPIKQIISAARAKGCRVIYIVTVHHPGDAGTGPDSVYWHKEQSLALFRKNPEWKDKLLLPGTWGTEIVAELEPQAGDVIVEKPRYSGFFDTNLVTILKRYNIKYLLTVGVATNNCVEATIRDAYYRGYFSVLVTDGAASTGPKFMQEAAIFNIKTFYGWATTTENVMKVMT